MVVGILKEGESENRVSITPDSIKELQKLNVEKILIEQNAGEKAFLTNTEYGEQGFLVVDKATLLKEANILVSIHSPSEETLSQLSKEQILLGQFNPLNHEKWVHRMTDAGMTTFSLDALPRTTRAQAMDVLSSMATAAGYRAVLLAAAQLPRFFPMFMTAAGTIKPAKVLIIGAGVAGLQAVATARRLGAVVHAFDVRAAAKEEVLSLGAKFVEVEGATDDAAAGGYAVEQTEAYKKRQAELVHEHALKSDIIICTAQIPGRKAPLIIHKETVEQMKSGSVIVDLAASSGGNCAVTQNDKTIQHQGVYVIGDSNLSSGIPTDASRMFSKNVVNFLKLLIKDGQLTLDFEDPLVAGGCITHKGEIINERVKNKFMQTA